MAPVCMAIRLSGLLGLLLLLFLSDFGQNVAALLVYDCQLLLKIRAVPEMRLKHPLRDQTSYPPPPPLLSNIPAYLRRLPYAIPQTKRPRRQGKRDGVLMRIRTFLPSLQGIDLGLPRCVCHPLSKNLLLCGVQGAVASSDCPRQPP